MDLLANLSGALGGGPSGLGLEEAMLRLLLAFACGQVCAWAYMYTHKGLSYSGNFVQSIILLAIIISLGMMVIGNNFVVAFGLIGALAVIRFRNILKDTRDTAFVFFSLIVGMATGTGNYALAILGTSVFCSVLLYLHWTYFGSRYTGDGFVRFHLDLQKAPRTTLQEVLDRYCRSNHLVSQRFQESGQGELAYQLTMRDPTRADDLVNELNEIEGVGNVTFVLHEEHVEV